MMGDGGASGLFDGPVTYVSLWCLVNRIKLRGQTSQMVEMSKRTILGPTSAAKCCQGENAMVRTE